ncbi:hypothetical protein AB0J74_22305 [Asanoa sp. NPDC049573]|uniref:hypothetical protein n=1 Tax=Asanoa sp. NPDC049573 TaxID=3155396 RepID=UPI00343C7F02
MVAAAPAADPAGPWRLASEDVAAPALFRVTHAAFGGVADSVRGGGVLTIGGGLVVGS